MISESDTPSDEEEEIEFIISSIKTTILSFVKGYVERLVREAIYKLERALELLEKQRKAAD